MKFDHARAQRALLRSWSAKTARQWRPDDPAQGQCNVTASLIHSLFGGEILKTRLPAGYHFYNRIDGQRIDFTAGQFATPIDYDDRESSRDEAAAGATPDELAHLKKAFLMYY